MNRTKIEWCDYTWNPVTGCRRGCSWCYARRIHGRFSKQPFEQITFHPARLREPARILTPARIFAGSMSDIEYWPAEQVDQILDVVNVCSWHTFMFLTKSPRAYHPYSWPPNSLQGLTLTCSQSHHLQESLVDSLMTRPRPYISVEPILGSITPSLPFHRLEFVILGAMTGPRPIRPRVAWIDSFLEAVPPDKIFFKDNIRSYLPPLWRSAANVSSMASLKPKSLHNSRIL